MAAMEEAVEAVAVDTVEAVEEEGEDTEMAATGLEVTAAMAVDPMEGARAVMEVDRVEAMAATEDEILYFTAKLTFQEFQFSILTLMFLRYSTVSEL